jgi:uncharacterized coiled-coil protein SlyX
VTADVEHEQGDDDRRAAETRPAPTPDRLISWGSPPAGLTPDPAADAGQTDAAADTDTDAEETAPEEASVEEAPPDRELPADEEAPAASPPEPTLPEPMPAEPPLEPATVEVSAPEPELPEPEPPAEPARRTWSSPTIAATPAREGAVAAEDPPATPARQHRVDRPREHAAGPADGPRGWRSSASPPPSSSPAFTPASGKPVSITELAHQLSAIQTQLGELSGRVAATGTSRVAQQMSTLHSQLNRVGEQLGRAVPNPAGERRSAERTASAITELSQQLAATQAQVASLSAQLTTLAHRITYDLERAGQATSERLVRDVPQHVAALLGPAVDDLTDQIEADRARLTEAVEVGLGQRLAAVGEVVDGLPLANVELMTNVQSLEADLEDRFARLAARLGDQVSALEQANGAELTRLREHVLDLHDLAVPASDRETVERMAGQVDRLSQRATDSTEVVDAVELLIAEHLEVLRDDVETRVAALGPLLQEELEVVRAEAVAGTGATEEALAERIDALEASLTARLDAALAEQVESIDGLVAERLSESLAELPSTRDGDGDATADALAEAMASVTEELKALRRRITLRFEGGDAPAGLSPDQLDDLAELLAKKLEGGGSAGPRKAAPARARAVKKA